MSDGVVKAISFIVFIFIGVLLKQKFTSKDEINGLKKIILYLALPATIFIALLKVDISTKFLAWPFIALGLNLFLFLVTPVLLLFLGITDKGTQNAAKLLIPSLAPGLSCFPFILEFLGEDYLAKAAMADLGNKFFVLFILYLIAIHWFYKNQPTSKRPLGEKLKSLIKIMLFEPVNIFIIVALLLVSFDIRITDLPLFLQENFYRLSYIMTPLVLLFIGLAVKIQNKQMFVQLFSILMLRAALTLFTIGSLITLLNITTKNEILFLLSFGLSACSFWPFAHISTIATKESNIPENKKTFNVNFALSMLALSLPISVILILGILTAGDTFVVYKNVLILSSILFFLGVMSTLYKFLKNGAQVNERYKHIEN